LIIIQSRIKVKGEILEVTLIIRKYFSPHVPNFDARQIITSNMQLLTGLKPGTEYRIEIIAVLSSGAETDLVETSFTTLGDSSLTRTVSECALTYSKMAEESTVLNSCSFEGKFFEKDIKIKEMQFSAINIFWN
jgi:hypothetical protein